MLFHAGVGPRPVAHQAVVGRGVLLDDDRLQAQPGLRGKGVQLQVLAHLPGRRPGRQRVRQTRKRQSFDPDGSRRHRHFRQDLARAARRHPAAVHQHVHPVQAQGSHHFVSRAPAAQLVVEKHRVLVKVAPRRRHALENQRRPIHRLGRDLHRRRPHGGRQLGAQRALFLGAARLPVAQGDARGAGGRGEAHRPEARAERVS